jgi:hypothetical protein
LHGEILKVTKTLKIMKKIIPIAGLFLTILFVSSFSATKTDVVYSKPVATGFHYVPDYYEIPKEAVQIPFVGKSFNGFREALAFKESQGRYTVVNSLGYLGKYQFGKSTLKRFNINDTHSFLNDPSLQEDAFLALCSVNKWILRKDIRRSVGLRINGTVITESGILAAAHLAGAGNVKKYLRSGGRYDFKDAFGSSIQYYMKRFSGYDTSFVEADRKPVL